MQLSCVTLAAATAGCGDDGGTANGVAASCRDGIRNGFEIDVDCGGNCGPCAVEQACLEASDCTTGLCEGGVCQAEASCDDGQQNGDETDVDCGGSCGVCDPGDRCAFDDDCSSSTCVQGRCRDPACDDNRQNGDETGVDCGGPDCGACSDGEGCAEAADCVSGVCEGGSCAAPTCSDGVQNGDELGLDCGAGCPGCPDGTICTEDADCASSVCDDEVGECVAASCDDGRLNQDESDVDCGGTACGACPDGAGCNEASDCESEICEANVCVAPSCTDGLPNGRETDVDCGGPVCASCPTGSDCALARDCQSLVCDQTTLQCAEASCEDGVRNGEEVDVDCGGDCGGCAVGQFCSRNEDCASGVCDTLNLVCEEPSCQDGITNQDETDRDCGGSECGACDDGEMCLVDEDCRSLLCNATSLTCDASSCSDGIRNGLETGVDCGGPDCAECPDFSDDFETGTIGVDYALSGDADWFASTDAINGTYSAESGDINDSQESIMELTVTVGSNGNVSFDWEVSSESGWDYLRFYIDGVEEDSWSGSQSGSESYALSAGTHTLKWAYDKDASISSLDDAGRVDDIFIQDGGP